MSLESGKKSAEQLRQEQRDKKYNEKEVWLWVSRKVLQTRCL